MIRILGIFCTLALVISCTETTNDTTIVELTKSVEQWKEKAESFEKEISSPTLMHTVYFWTKEGLSEADEKSLVEGCKSLAKIESVSRLRMGKPAPSEARDVVDHSYSYALNVEFVDNAAQEAYQIDPIHLQFIEDHKDKWTKVIVYDNMME